MTDDDEYLIRAYRVCFGTPDGRAVLADLMRFCRFRVELPDDGMAVAEGMRRVFLRIVQMARLSDEQLIALYAGRMPAGEDE